MKLRATCNCGCDNVVNIELDDFLNKENPSARSFAEMEMIATLKSVCWKGKISVKEVKFLDMIEETKLFLKLKENLENALESSNEFEIDIGLVGIHNIKRNLKEDLNILKRAYTRKYKYDLDSIEIKADFEKIDGHICRTNERIAPKDILRYP